MAVNSPGKVTLGEICVLLVRQHRWQCGNLSGGIRCQHPAWRWSRQFGVSCGGAGNVQTAIVGKEEIGRAVPSTCQRCQVPIDDRAGKIRVAAGCRWEEVRPLALTKAVIVGAAVMNRAVGVIAPQLPCCISESQAPSLPVCRHGNAAKRLTRPAGRSCQWLEFARSRDWWSPIAARRLPSRNRHQPPPAQQSTAEAMGERL